MAGALAYLIDPAAWSSLLRLVVQGGCFLAAYALMFRILPGGHARFTAIRKVLRGEAESPEDDR